jgi:hypothetical protein
MAALDWIFVALLLASMLTGAWRGLVYEFLSLAGWVVAFVVAQWFAQDAAALLPIDEAQETVRYAAGFILVFIVTVFACGFLAWLGKKLVEAIGLRPAPDAGCRIWCVAWGIDPAGVGGHGRVDRTGPGALVAGGAQRGCCRIGSRNSSRCCRRSWAGICPRDADFLGWKATMCGIVGVISTSPVNQLIYDALLLLQHRGRMLPASPRSRNASSSCTRPRAWCATCSAPATCAPCRATWAWVRCAIPRRAMPSAKKRRSRST